MYHHTPSCIVPSWHLLVIGVRSLSHFSRRALSVLCCISSSLSSSAKPYGGGFSARRLELRVVKESGSSHAPGCVHQLLALTRNEISDPDRVGGIATGTHSWTWDMASSAVIVEGATWRTTSAWHLETQTSLESVSKVQNGDKEQLTGGPCPGGPHSSITCCAHISAPGFLVDGRSAGCGHPINCRSTRSAI